MPTLKETAQAYEKPQLIKNIADIGVVPVDVSVTLETKTDKEGKDYTIYLALLNSEQYRVPPSVLEEIKDIIEMKPEVTHVKVKKSGQGMETRYKVVAL